MNTKRKKGDTNKNTPKAEVNKASDQQLEHESDSLFTSGLQLLEAEDVKRHFLIEGIIPGGTIALLCGSSDLGKSIFARQIAVSAALGRDTVAGFTLNLKYNRSIYVTTEDGSVYSGETDHPIPWRTDHLKDWRTVVSNAIES